MPFKPLQLSYGEAFSALFSGTGKMYYNTGNDMNSPGIRIPQRLRHVRV
jgi:hypothetical protein